METTLLIELIAKVGIPTALELYELWSKGGTVTPEIITRIKLLGTRTAADYEKAPQP